MVVSYHSGMTSQPRRPRLDLHCRESHRSRNCYWSHISLHRICITEDGYRVIKLHHLCIWAPHVSLFVETNQYIHLTLCCVEPFYRLHQMQSKLRGPAT